MMVCWGRSLSSKRFNRDGYVFFFARSPDAPMTTMERVCCLVWNIVNTERQCVRERRKKNENESRRAYDFARAKRVLILERVLIGSWRKWWVAWSRNGRKYIKSNRPADFGRSIHGDDWGCLVFSRIFTFFRPKSSRYQLELSWNRRTLCIYSSPGLELNERRLD